MLEQLRWKVQPGLGISMEQIYFSQRFPCNVIFLKKTPLLQSSNSISTQIRKGSNRAIKSDKTPVFISSAFDPRKIRFVVREDEEITYIERGQSASSYPRILFHVHIHAHIHKQGITRFNNHVPSTDHILSPRRPLASVTPTANHPFPLSLSLAMHAHRKHHQLGGRVS